MTPPELTFAIANNGVLPFWGLLVLLPRWSGTRIAVHSAVRRKFFLEPAAP